MRQEHIIYQIYDDIYNIWQKTNSMSGVVIYVFVAIDAFSFLAMPSEQSKNDKNDFMRWVDKYLKTEQEQPYQYVGKDFYGARCATLHAFSAESDYAKQNDCKIFGYHDGSEHYLNNSVNKNLVMLSVPRLIDNFKHAVVNFSQDILNDSTLQACTAQRKNKILQLFNL